MSKIIDRTGEIGYNNQGLKMTIIAYRNYEDIDVQFEDGIIVYHKSYGNFKISNIKHPIRYEESFAYHIEVELGLNLDDIWNWDKNNENGINPYEIYRSSGKEVWLYCLEKAYHNYDKEGNKVGYKTTCDSFYRGRRCGYCGSPKKIHYKDSLAYKHPQIAKMIAIKENNLIFDDCYNISCSSSKKFYFKCLDCENISNKKYSLHQIQNNHFSCKYCSDGISLPEKFIINIFNQLNIKFTYQLTKKDFNWCNYYEYDFYIPIINGIIETHGVQHYEENINFRRNLYEEQMNDLFKYKCAKGHVNNYIVIDCRYSELKWLKDNIIKELSDYFDLSNINWELAWEESQKSLCVEAWELWNNGIHSTRKISDILGLSQGTIIRYLKYGVECNKCNYSKNESLRICREKQRGKNHGMAKGVICLTTKKIFFTIREGAIYYNCCESGISNCCNSKRNYCGKLNDGTKLVWRYLNWKHNKKYRIK